MVISSPTSKMISVGVGIPVSVLVGEVVWEGVEDGLESVAVWIRVGVADGLLLVTVTAAVDTGSTEMEGTMPEAAVFVQPIRIRVSIASADANRCFLISIS